MSECCSGNVKIVYPCSGAADVGEISDKVARKLRDEGYAQMSCLAGIGAGLSGFVETAKGANAVITVDGCSMACAKKSLERIGVSPTPYILTEFGLKKGSTPLTDEAISGLCEKIKKTQPPTKPGQTSSDCGCEGKY